MSRLELEERYGYYRRCQHFRKGGEQCKGPAMKDETLCYKHEQQEQMRRRRERQFLLPPLRDLKTVQQWLGEVAKAIIENRIDEDYASELLGQLERASAALRDIS